MKILHVFRSPVGGLFRHVVDLANGQIERGHDVGLIADSTTGNALSEVALAALAPKLALGLCRIPIRRNPHLADVAAIWRVARRIHSTGAEIVHGHGAKGGALARLAPAENAIIRAYTPHGGSLHDGVGGRLHILMERMLMAQGQLYLFESAYSHDIYRRKVGNPAATVNVVHNGIRRDELQAVGIDADASDIVYLGELRALKGVDVLLDALALLRRTGRKVTARLVGDGPDRAEFEAQIAQLELASCVKLCGPLPTRAALALGRVAVLPSRAESFPYVVLEAAAAARPLVATKVGDIPKIFGPYADRLVAPGNAEALADAILTAIDQPAEALANANALRSRIETEFSADAMVDAILNSYRQARSAFQKAADVSEAQARAGLPS
jgi:glycosyltransferase involved in cell wall biosynthesis